MPLTETGALDKRALLLKPLVVVLATHESLQWLIKYGQSGVIFVDSSSRHKTNCNAPMTYVMVVNEIGIGLPGAVFVTSDIRASTLEVSNHHNSRFACQN